MTKEESTFKRTIAIEDLPFCPKCNERVSILSHRSSGVTENSILCFSPECHGFFVGQTSDVHSIDDLNRMLIQNWTNSFKE